MTTRAREQHDGAGPSRRSLARRVARAAFALALAPALAALACTSNASDPQLLAACNLFYSHLDGSGACQSCAANAPSACNRPGLDTACSSTSSCTSKWCDGAQCQCPGLSDCMASAGSNCSGALYDYYNCSNTGCASECGGAMPPGRDAGGPPGTDAAAPCVCPPGESCPATRPGPSAGAACGITPNSNQNNAGFGIACATGLVCAPGGTCVSPQYTLGGIGVVIDQVTGLAWQQTMPSDPCPQDGAGSCTYADAMSYCAGLQLGGVTGWTLPTVEQLFSLVDQGGCVATDSTFFANSAWVFWSSTLQPGNSQNAWTVGFAGGDALVNAANLPILAHVRCVRSRKGNHPQLVPLHLQQ
jgi:hypothetical protein